MRPAARLAVAAVAAVGLLGCAQTPTVVDTSAQDLSVPPSDGAAATDAGGACGRCDPPTPLCDARARRCVACLADDDCPEATVCKAGQCVPGCSPTHRGCGDAGSCDLDAGVCHGCRSDRDCRDPRAAFCDVPSGRCSPCTPDHDICPDGAYCAETPGGYACMLGCKVDGDCALAFGREGACCLHTCVDLSTSHDHCGACNAGCGNGTCCGRRCVDAQVDTRNCGACGVVCPSGNSQAVCKAGRCEAGVCQPGFADCDMVAQNGCEVSIASDRNHCGACGNTCMIAHADALCLGGACVIGACKLGYRDCNGRLGDGCETSVASDPQNCGACGADCANLPNAVAACVGGACVIGACGPGFGNCNAMDADGCESVLGSDAQNCGACGNTCPAPPNVATSCRGGMCSMGGCLPGFGDCDGNPGNGCEAKLGTDAQNCGACGKVCGGGGQNAVAACKNAACTLACNAGWGDCDGNAGNGCELDVRADAANCGACGNVCPVNKPVCSAGVCTAIDLSNVFSQYLSEGRKVYIWKSAMCADLTQLTTFCGKRGLAWWKPRSQPDAQALVTNAFALDNYHTWIQVYGISTNPNGSQVGGYNVQVDGPGGQQSGGPNAFAAFRKWSSSFCDPQSNQNQSCCWDKSHTYDWLVCEDP